MIAAAKYGLVLNLFADVTATRIGKNVNTAVPANFNIRFVVLSSGNNPTWFARIVNPLNSPDPAKSGNNGEKLLPLLQ